MVKTTVIGIDVGTSGCRAMAIDSTGKPLAKSAIPLPASVQQGAAVQQQPQQWWLAIDPLMRQLLEQITPDSVAALALDGTSGTVLLVDGEGEPLGPALMYNDNRASAQAARIAAVAPEQSAAHGTGSGLAKAMWLLAQQGDSDLRIQSQAGWLSGMLCGRFDLSDENNALKLGYDPISQHWPVWLERLAISPSMLPKVVWAGTPLGRIRPELARRWGLPETLRICAGTTDSTAAFLASGATAPGEAVTSLGSTLVLKVIAEEPLFAPEYGLYSQPLGELWLAGGSSNSGGAVLRQFFTDAEMARLTEDLHPEHPTGLDYYPLPGPGERFPHNDPTLMPRLAPRSRDNARFFQGLLEGIARIEKEGYERLAELGAPYPTSVRTLGGGAANRAWTEIRARLLGVPLLPAKQTQACYGSALLALWGVKAQIC